MIKSNQTGFYDLNINERCFQEPDLKHTLKALYNLGYRTVAVNQIIETDGNQEPKKKKKKGEPRDNADCVPNPYDLQIIRKLATKLDMANITFLNRLTLIFSNQDNMRKFLKSNNFKKYDIIGVIPTTAQALAFTCSSLEADILTFDPQNRFSIKLNRKIYSQLIEKGFHLELTYSFAIEDSTKRKNLIYVSHLYHTYGKSRNIIFSSGAENYMLLRSPYDVISLGFLFGLNELQSKNAVMHHPRNVTVNAVGRRHGKAVMFVENIDDSVEVVEDDTEPIIIDSDESEDENMDTDEPAQKKAKQ